MKLNFSLIYFYLLRHILLAYCTTDNMLNNMLISFITYDNRPTSLLIPNLCWKRSKLKSLALTVNEVAVNLAASLQRNRAEHRLQQILILADLSCPNTHQFLIKASEEGYFKSPYRWLLLDLSRSSNRSNVLEHLDMVIDSDVVIARMIKDEVIFSEVYKISKNSELIYTTRFMWHPPNTSSNKKYNLNTNISTFEDKYENNTSISIYAEAYSDKVNIKRKGVTVSQYGAMTEFRETNVLSIRRKNLRGHPLTMANVITDSNETKQHLDDRLFLHQDSITKMSYIAVKICIEMLNATEKLIFTHTWGYKDNDGNWQGIVDYLIKKEADFGTLMIFTQERMKVIDYIAMVGRTAVRFVFREPPLAYVANIYLMPFSFAVWLAISTCVLSCALFLYITSKWEAKFENHPAQLNGSWADVFILVLGVVLQQGSTLEPRRAAGRCVTLLLLISTTILYAAYSANIVVLLGAPSSSVRSLKDLLHSPLQVGASDFEYNRYFFKKLNEPIRKAIYDKKIAPKGKKENYYTMEEGVKRIRQGLFAFHMELYPGYRLIQETYQEEEKCDLVEIDYINEIDPWIPGQKRGPFNDLFKISFIKIRESGIQACNHRRVHVLKPKCHGVVSTFSSVGVKDMYPALIATLYLVFLAPVVLSLEILHHRLVQMRGNRMANIKFCS